MTQPLQGIIHLRMYGSSRLTPIHVRILYAPSVCIIPVNPFVCIPVCIPCLASPPHACVYLPSLRIPPMTPLGMKPLSVISPL